MQVDVPGEVREVVINPRNYGGDNLHGTEIWYICKIWTPPVGCRADCLQMENIEHRCYPP